MVALPNNKWIRSPKKPEYAVCLDKQNKFYGWKTIESITYDDWRGIARLTREELIKATKKPAFKDHLIELNDLLNA